MLAMLSSKNCHCKSSPGSCEAERQTAADFLSCDQANQREIMDPDIDSYSDYNSTIIIFWLDS